MELASAHRSFKRRPARRAIKSSAAGQALQEIDGGESVVAPGAVVIDVRLTLAKGRTQEPLHR
jgi:hypothetical protein